MFLKNILYCQRCGKEFKQEITRAESWFTKECICFQGCYTKEKTILVFLGEDRYKYQNCGYVPTLEQITRLEEYQNGGENDTKKN